MTTTVNRSGGWKAHDKATLAALQSIAKSLEAMANPPVDYELKESPHTGTPMLAGDAPSVPQGSLPDPTGARLWLLPTPEQGADHPNLPHSGEQGSPEGKRAAYLGITQGLESQLLATREQARTMGWEDTAWAADRLLQAVLRLPVPEVPVDDTVGQGTLEEMLGEALGRRLDPAVFDGPSSTPVEEPGEED